MHRQNFKVIITLTILSMICYHVCAVCPAGKYGTECAMNCSVTCAGPQNACDSTTGECLDCDSGYHGVMCKQECGERTYGSSCHSNCSHLCLDQRCDRVTGWCDQCPPGYSGRFCFDYCPPGTYGAGCANQCSSHCARIAQNVCDPWTGRCIACTHEYRGADCEDLAPPCSTCLHKVCDSVFGNCTECPLGYAGEYCDPVTLPGQAGPSTSGDRSRSSTFGPNTGGVAGGVVAAVVVAIWCGTAAAQSGSAKGNKRVASSQPGGHPMKSKAARSEQSCASRLDRHSMPLSREPDQQYDDSLAASGRDGGVGGDAQHATALDSQNVLMELLPNAGGGYDDPSDAPTNEDGCERPSSFASAGNNPSADAPRRKLKKS